MIIFKSSQKRKVNVIYQDNKLKKNVINVVEILTVNRAMKSVSIQKQSEIKFT